jgi:hypothetical protein
MKTIVVAGDLLWDYNLAQHPAAVNFHHEALQHTVLHHQPGGAWYLADMIGLACDQMEARISEAKRDAAPLSSNPSSVNRAYSIWSLHERSSVGEDKKKRVWRIQKFLGCESAAEALAPAPVQHDVPSPDVLALDDLNLGFRHQEKLWPAALKAGNPVQIVIKTAPPFDGPLWEKLLGTQLADRLTVVLPVAALRARQATISRALSWDRTINDIVDELTNGVSAQDLGRCRRVIVHFGVAGAASFTRHPFPRAHAPLLPRARFERCVYHPDELEGSWKDKHPGASFGATSILTAALVRHALQPADYPLFIALTHGLAAMKAKHAQGGGENRKKCGPQAAPEKVKEVLSPPPAPLTKADKDPPPQKPEEKKPEEIYCTAYPRELLSEATASEPAKITPTLLLDVTGPGLEYVAAKAMEVVLRGPQSALRSAPKARYGDYQTVDHEEIERINILRNLISDYGRNLKDKRPLSIAVFGSPGSGKSFAIKELAGELFGGNKAILEFNLSQFQSVNDLHRAFHQVRDASVQGQIPLVF